MLWVISHSFTNFCAFRLTYSLQPLSSAVSCSTKLFETLTAKLIPLQLLAAIIKKLERQEQGERNGGWDSSHLDVSFLSDLDEVMLITKSTNILHLFIAISKYNTNLSTCCRIFRRFWRLENAFSITSCTE